MNVYEKLQEARVKLQSKNIKKSGKNSFSKFTYYELADFIPTLNLIFSEIKLCSNFSIENNIAQLLIINSEKPDETIKFTMPTANLELKGCTAIQALGGVNTYCRRYLYLNALEIVEAEMLDAKAGSKDFEEIKKKDDSNIYRALANIKDIETLKEFYELNKENVNDKNAFYTLVKERQKIIKEAA